MAAAIVGGNYCAAIIESRCTKHRGIEHRFKPHLDDAPDTAHHVHRSTIAVTAAPHAKLVAKLFWAFVIAEFKRDGLSGFEIAIEARGDTPKCGA